MLTEQFIQHLIAAHRFIVPLFALLMISTACAQIPEQVQANPLEPSVKPAVSEKLRSDFLASTNHSAFVQQALKRPLEGGYHYAFLALRDCTRWRLYQSQMQDSNELSKLISSKPIQKALDGQRQLAKQCAQFKEDQALQLYISTRYDSKLADPLMDAQLDFEQTLWAVKDGVPAKNLISKLQTQLQHIYSLNDPTFPTHQLIAQIAVRATHNSTIWFDNVQYGNSNAGHQPNRAAIESMIELALCDHQTYCSIDRKMKEVCTMLSQCFDSRIDFARDIYLQSRGYGNANQFNAALKLLPQIQSRLEKLDVEAFLPPTATNNKFTPQSMLTSKKVTFKKEAEQPGTAARKAAEIDRVTQKMREAYSNSTDYAAFIKHALQRPHEGGYFYAKDALHQCEQLINYMFYIKNSDSSSYYKAESFVSKPESTQEKLPIQCANLTESTIKEYLKLLEVNNPRLQPVDPLYKTTLMLRQYNSGTFNVLMIPDFLSEFKVLAALRYPPIQPASYVARLITPLSEGSVWFNGTEYLTAYADSSANKNSDDVAVPCSKAAIDIKPNGVSIHNLLSTTPCRSYADCMLQVEVSDECAASPDCVESAHSQARDAFVKARRGSAEQFDAALRLRPQVRAAVKAGNLSAFLKPSYYGSGLDDLNIQPTPPKNAQSAFAKLRAEYRTSQDHYAFALSALKRPREGGYFYATQALRQCSYFDPEYIFNFKSLHYRSEDLIASLNDVAIRLLKSTLTPCKSNRIQKLLEKIQSPAFTDPKNLSKDPLMKAKLNMEEALDVFPTDEILIATTSTNTPQNPQSLPETVTAQFKAMVQANDPSLPYAFAVNRTARALSGDGSQWFEGIQYKDYDSPGRKVFTSSSVRNVIYLAVCLELGCGIANTTQLVCGGHSSYRTDSLVYWLQAGGCSDDYNHDPKQYDAALKQLPRFRKAIRSGNLSAFLPPQNSALSNKK